MIFWDTFRGKYFLLRLNEYCHEEFYRGIEKFSLKSHQNSKMCQFLMKLPMILTEKIILFVRFHEIQGNKLLEISENCRVGKDLSPPLPSLYYKHLMKSIHIASKYYRCRTQVPNFMKVTENDYSNGCVWNLIIVTKMLIFLAKRTIISTPLVKLVQKNLFYYQLCFVINYLKAERCIKLFSLRKSVKN